eukprot:Gb_15740 [translate_table: standard]
MVGKSLIASFNLFSSPPSIPKKLSENTHKTYAPPQPIPIPNPNFNSNAHNQESNRKKENEPSQNAERALKSFHYGSGYYKPLQNRGNGKDKGKHVYKHRGRYTTKLTEGEGEEVDDNMRGVSLGSSGISYRVPDAPFEFQFSYSETPKEKPLALREPPYVPFAPPTMPRPWTGRAPLPKSKKKLPEFDSFNPPPPGTKGIKYVQPPGPYLLGQGPKDARTRDQILGEPLSRKEILELVESCIRTNRQINLGRDGLTHNMLELIHTHWKRRRVCKVKCKGVPTVDMDNVCYHLEEKTGGKIIHRVGGVVYLFRGRNYNYKTRPRFPLMLWKPATPVYPKLIQRAPAGLTEAEADALRRKGRRLLPICKLGKNGVYFNLVKDVREAFEENELVRINCKGMHASDYKKIGAKLKELVPCVLLSFDKEHILMWRGEEWKSKNAGEVSPVSSIPARELSSEDSSNSGVSVIASARESSSNDSTNSNVSSMMSSEPEAVELIKIGEIENVFDKRGSVQTREEYDVDASKLRTGSDANCSSRDLAYSSRSLDMPPFHEVKESLKLDELTSASDTQVMFTANDVSFEPVSGEESSDYTCVATDSSEVSSESISPSTVGMSMINAEINESIEDGDIDSSPKPDCAEQIEMQGGDNLFDDTDAQEMAMPITSEANEQTESAQDIEFLWVQAIESRQALFLDEPGLDPDTLLKKANDFAEIAPSGPYFEHKQILSRRKSGMHRNKAPGDEENNQSEGNMTSQGISTEEKEEIPLFSDTVPLGSLPIDELVKRLAT